MESSTPEVARALWEIRLHGRCNLRVMSSSGKVAWDQEELLMTSKRTFHKLLAAAGLLAVFASGCCYPPYYHHRRLALNLNVGAAVSPGGSGFPLICHLMRGPKGRASLLFSSKDLLDRLKEAFGRKIVEPGPQLGGQGVVVQVADFGRGGRGRRRPWRPIGARPGGHVATARARSGGR